MATKASNVAVTVGRASREASPQLSPAMIDRWGPGTSTMCPAATAAPTQAAVSGSTPTSSGPSPGSRPARRLAPAAAPSAPTPRGTNTASTTGSPVPASWASISVKMVV